MIKMDVVVELYFSLLIQQLRVLNTNLGVSTALKKPILLSLQDES